MLPQTELEIALAAEVDRLREVIARGRGPSQKPPADIRKGDLVFSAASIAVRECSCGVPHIDIFDAAGDMVATASVDPAWAMKFVCEILDRCGQKVVTS